MALHSTRMKLFPLMIFITVTALAVIIWSSIKLYQAHDYNNNLLNHALHNNTTLASNETIEALFANAVRYEARGELEKSLATYAKLIAKSDSTTDADLRKATYFNVGNLYLNDAVNKLEKEGLPAWDVAGPLVSFAKESYQKALRVQSDWSEAKYNYQLALRLAPTSHGMHGPQLYEDDAIKQEEKPSGWPAMPGSLRGMP